MYVYSAAPQLHVTIHKFKRREGDEEKKGGIILFFFFKAAHYPAVSGCMAPSQNIMMRINSPGTTSFCWRPSQGSASALPLKLFPSFSPFPSSPFITDTLVFAPCHPLMGSLAAVAAYRPSLGLLHFLHSLSFLSPCSPSLLLSLCTC